MGRSSNPAINPAIGNGLIPSSMAPADVDKRLLLAKPASAATPALLLDRERMIIEDRHHIYDPAAVQLCPGTWQLIHHASQAGWPVVVITNSIRHPAPEQPDL
jgi:hypothetical protein